MPNCTRSGDPIFQSCDDNVAHFFCAIGNISGYISTVMWFLVLVPQVFRNFRFKSVIGISPGWAILNFTAAFNNAFFVFKTGCMPWYVYGSAVYMPILEILLLIQFILFTPKSKWKFLVAILLTVFWIGLEIAQSVFDIYKQLEWLSIVLWSAETFPQIFLNMKRRSTYGLSTMMVAITAIGKTTDFLSNYLLVMPLQYVIMAFFSSTVAQVQTLQVLWYWNQPPPEQENQENFEPKITAKTCHIIRFLGMTFFTLEIAVYAVSLLLRTKNWWYAFAPAGTYAIIIGYYVYSRNWCPVHTRISNVKTKQAKENQINM